jgi:hypothetical protein
MERRILKPFINSTATLLFLTAAAKLYSAAGSARILTVTDPLLHTIIKGSVNEIVIFSWRNGSLGRKIGPWLGRCGFNTLGRCIM